MKKLLTMSLLVTTTVVPVIGNLEEAKAQTSLPQNMQVGKKVELRKGATSSYNVVTSVSTGEKVTVIDQFKNASGESWLRVSSNGMIGWGPADHFLDLGDAWDLVGKKTTIVGSNVNLRSGASISYKSVTKLNNGAQVSVTSVFKNASGELWYKVTSGSSSGWIMSTYLKNSTPAPPVPISQKTVVTDSQLRSGATTSYKILSTVPKGQKLGIIGEFKNSSGELWYRTTFGTHTGWIPSTAFEVVNVVPPPPDPVDIPAEGTVVYAGAQDLKVRSGATIAYKVVATLDFNRALTVQTSFVDAKGDVWLRVKVSDTVSGWVPMVDLSVTAAPLNQTMYVSVDIANLRSDASMSADVISQASMGTALKTVDSKLDAGGDTWYKIITPNGQVAWAHSSVLSLQSAVIGKSMIVGTKNAQLLSGAAFSYKLKEKLTYGSKVTVLQQFINASKETWYQVKSAKGNTGWVPSYEIVSKYADYTTLYTTGSTPLRKGASASYAASATLAANTSIIVLRELNGWYNVETSGGSRGWILTSQTSPVSSKALTAPTASVVKGSNYLNWKKASNFSFSYSTSGTNTLKLSGGITNAAIPTVSVPGIEKVSVTSINAHEKAVLITFKPGYTYTIRNHKDTVSIKVVPLGLKGKKIMIDAGHGGKDSGSVGYTGLLEKIVNLQTAILVKAELEKYGAIVELTRSTDIFLELAERTSKANATDFDAFISIHADSFNATSKGSSVFYNTSLNFNGSKSSVMAQSVLKNMVNQLGTVNRGAFNQSLYVNKYNELPSILVELAFLSNPKEEAQLKTTPFRQKAATGIRLGLQEYFNKF